MKKRAYLMLGLALLLAAATVLLAQKFMGSRGNESDTAQVKTVKIVIAKIRLNYGAIINPEHLRVIPWPKGAVPEGSFSSIRDVVRRDEHRVVLRRIEKDEPVLKVKVSGFGGRASLSAIISSKMRAATIRVNDVNGVAGFVLPGDRVDIMITRDPTSTGGRRSMRGANLATDVLLQNVKVLGIDQEADDSKDKPSVAKAVTVEVTPQQAQKLVLAQQVGVLSLSLRNVNNSDAVPTKTVTLRDLRIGEVVERKPKAPVRRVRRKTRTAVKRASSVKIFRALKSSEYNVIREPRADRRPVPSSALSPRKPTPRPKSGALRSVPPSSGAASQGEAIRRPSADGKPIPLTRPPAPRTSDQEANAERQIQATDLPQ